MTRWIGLVVVIGIGALAWTVDAWAPGLLAFLDAEGSRIKSLQSLLQLALWVAEALVLLLLYFRSTRKQEEGSGPVDTGGGAYFNGPVKVKGDFVNGDKIVTGGTVEGKGKAEDE
ncbi:hypothetical protein [Endothiovibrio diazotrophicus]